VQDTAEQMTQCLSSCTHAWSIFDRASWALCHIACEFLEVLCRWSFKLRADEYQLNDTISSIDIAEHCSFIQLWWCPLCGMILQVGLAKGRSCWGEWLYYSYSVWHKYGMLCSDQMPLCGRKVLKAPSPSHVTAFRIAARLAEPTTNWIITTVHPVCYGAWRNEFDSAILTKTTSMKN